MKCVHCRKQFNGRSNALYCSVECRRADYREKGYCRSRKPKMKRRCKLCGHWFQPKTHSSTLCSRKCTSTFWRNKNRVHYKKRRCNYCGHWFQPKAKHEKYCCRSCNSTNFLRTRRPAIKQLCVDYKDGKCKVCGYNKCLAALENWHFHPATRNGAPIPSKQDAIFPFKARG